MCLIVKYKVPSLCRQFDSQMSVHSPRRAVCTNNMASQVLYLYVRYKVLTRLPVPTILILNVCTKSLLGSLYQQHGILCIVEYLDVRYKVPTRLFVLTMLNPKS